MLALVYKPVMSAEPNWRRLRGNIDLASYQGCAAIDQFATPLAATSDQFAYLSISPDGSKVAWQEGGNNYPQVRFHDFNTGLDQAIYGTYMHDQEQPSADNEWIVWSENWNNNYFWLEQFSRLHPEDWKFRSANTDSG